MSTDLLEYPAFFGYTLIVFVAARAICGAFVGRIKKSLKHIPQIEKLEEYSEYN